MLHFTHSLHWDTKTGIQKPGYKNRDTKTGIQKPGYKNRDTKTGIQKPGYKNRDTKTGIQKPGYKNRDTGSSIQEARYRKPTTVGEVFARDPGRQGDTDVKYRLDLPGRMRPGFTVRPGYTSMSNPGLSTPLGSTARLAALRAWANGSGRCWSYHCRCRRPTAW